MKDDIGRHYETQEKWFENDSYRLGISRLGLDSIQLRKKG
jgi:hypothetical protein